MRTVITKVGPYLYLGSFSFQLGRSGNVDHLDLAIAKESKQTKLSALWAVSEKIFANENLLTTLMPKNLP